ncbi:YjbQ family protein [bacterium]|nr:YjbQ family protein [bacterium]
MFKIHVSTRGFTDIIDITSLVKSQIEKEKIKEGVVCLFVTGSTAALTTIEYEPGLKKDFQEIINQLIPENKDYYHNQKWGDGNGFAHLRASLIGPSLVVPLEKGQLVLGTWQQIVLVDFDNRPREREIVGVVVKGE